MCKLRSNFLLGKNPYSKERPHFGPRQIRTLRGLHVGQKVIEFNEGSGVYNLLKVVAFEKDNFIKVNAIGFDGRNKYEKSISLVDHSIMSDDDFDPKKWNCLWCLLRTKAKTERGLNKTKQKNLIRKR